MLNGWGRSHGQWVLRGLARRSWPPFFALQDAEAVQVALDHREQANNHCQCPDKEQKIFHDCLLHGYVKAYICHHTASQGHGPHQRSDSSSDDVTEQTLCHESCRVILRELTRRAPSMTLGSWWLALTVAVPASFLHARSWAKSTPPGNCFRVCLPSPHPLSCPEFLLPSCAVLTIVSRSLARLVL